MTLRLPETLHQQLAQVAEQEGVSLNQYIVYALILADRKVVTCDPELTTETIDRLRAKLQAAKH